MSNQNVSRRQTLKAIGGSAATVSLAGCSASPFGESEFEAHINQLESDYKKYDNNLEAAFSDGFTDILGPKVPGLGWNIIDLSEGMRQIEEGFDPEQPNALTFDDEGNLGSVGWGFPAEQVGTPDFFKDDGVDAEEKWHVHQTATHIYADGSGEQTPESELSPDDLLINENWTEIIPADASIEPGQTFESAWGRIVKGDSEFEQTEERIIDFVSTHPDLLNLNVWITGNENGVFAPTKPDFAQG